MHQEATTPFKGLLAAAFFAGLIMAGQAQAQAQATGEIGEHVRNLKAHIDTYTEEVHWLIGKVDGIVDTYEQSGAAAAEPARLVDHWEAVKFHAAIETNFVPLYAGIWQGLVGVQEAITKEQPMAAVRKQQQMLEQNLWQSLGAVKLAAKYQSEEQTATANGGEALGPLATIDEIKHNLDKIVVEFAEREFEEAKDLVHKTYATRFEGIEGALIEQDADLVEDLEKDFNVTLPKQLNAQGSMSSVKQIIKAMHKKLDRARDLLATAEKDKRSVF